MDNAAETVQSCGMLKSHLQPSHLGEAPGTVNILAINILRHAVLALILNQTKWLIND
jgi:hypothetical protein